MKQKELTIKEANCRIKQIDNQLEYYLNKKERAFNKTQPKAVNITDEVKGTSREDKFSTYTVVCEKIDPIIDDLQNEKTDLLNFIEKELKRIDEYHVLEQQVIYYKEIYIPKNNFETTWWYIANKVHASESTCKRIYKKYKKQRNV